MQVQFGMVVMAGMFRRGEADGVGLKHATRGRGRKGRVVGLVILQLMMRMIVVFHVVQMESLMHGVRVKGCRGQGWQAGQHAHLKYKDKGSETLRDSVFSYLGS